jgi:phosphomannomutase
MAHPVIKFGTDGWRGIIASDFTFENVRTAAGRGCLSACAKRSGAEAARRGLHRVRLAVFVGGLCAACAEVVAATGIPVKLAKEITPTPALSYGVRELGRRAAS